MQICTTANGCVVFCFVVFQFCFKTGEECGKQGQDSAACYARFPGLGITV